MSFHKYQSKVSNIIKTDQQFGDFLKQIKAKSNLSQRNISTNSNRQSNQDQFTYNKKKKCSQIQQNPQYQCEKRDSNRVVRCNQDKNGNELQVYKNSYNLFKFTIKSPDRTRPGLSLFSGEQMIKKQQSNQLMQLKSSKQLPPWLFQQIRIKNIDRLKNINIKKNYQKPDQQDQDISQNCNYNKTKKGQICRNIPHILQQKDQNQRIMKNNRSKNQFLEERRKSMYLHRQNPSKIMLSSEAKNTPQNKRIHKISNNQDLRQIQMSDYSYNYDAYNQSEERSTKRSNFKSAKDNYYFKSQSKAKRQRTHQQLKLKHPRITQNTYKFNKKVLSPLSKRQRTISQEEPLIQPRKFSVC